MRSRLLVLIAVLLALPLAFACSAADKSADQAKSIAGGVGSKLAAVDVVHAAAAKSSDSGTVSFEMTMQTSGATDELTKALGLDSIKASGAIDFDARRESLSMNMFFVKIEMIVADDATYMRLDGIGESKWYREDASGDPAMGDTFSAETNPANGLSLLTGVAPDIHAVGEDDIRGVHATHYQGTVDLTKEAAEKGFGSADDVGITTFPVDVWIDGEGRVVRITETLDYSHTGTDSTAAKDVAETITMDFFDYGKPVDIQAPDPADVTDKNPFDDLFGALGSDQNP